MLNRIVPLLLLVLLFVAVSYSHSSHASPGSSAATGASVAVVAESSTLPCLRLGVPRQRQRGCATRAASATSAPTQVALKARRHVPLAVEQPPVQQAARERGAPPVRRVAFGGRPLAATLSSAGARR